MKKMLLIPFAFACFTSALAEDYLPKDTLYTELKKDIVILSSTKETNSLKSLPAAVSVFSSRNLEGFQAQSMKDLTAFVPNYFVPDYGAKLTAPIYIRGIGARSGTQTVGYYLDNVPFFNTTSFDTELFDIQRIEVLRGTQGTLYGRNAMGGIINIYTYSPLTYQGTRARVGGGNYGQFLSNVSHYGKINDKMGFSIGGYYNSNDGFFTNEYTGKKADHLKNPGIRAKFAWDASPRFSLTYSVNYDYVDQGAFPYASTSTKQIDFNSPSDYKRKLLTNGLQMRYTGEGYEINSTTGYQYLNDKMNMDQDYTRMSYFMLKQNQIQNSLSQEITIKSDNKSNYKWSYGVFGFYDYLQTDSPVYMGKDGVKHILQRQMDGLKASNPKMPQITYVDTVIPFPNLFKRPAYGLAIFHQSTLNNLASIQGLSATVGLRLDYEKETLEYNAGASANIKIGASPMPYNVDTTITGKSSVYFIQLLPKAVLKYQFDGGKSNSFVYASASKGYKAGGHNIQIFGDFSQDALTAKMKSFVPSESKESSPSDINSINDRITYNPEFSWNYEIGGHADIIENILTADASLFYIDVRDLQVTQFIESGYGRMVKNAGRATSKGFELGVKVRPCNGFFLYANYGLADARFKDYKTEIQGRDQNGQPKKVPVDYAGNRIPFAPAYTASFGGSVTRTIKNSALLDRVTLDANYAGVGRTYWDESNLSSQGFYGTVDARILFEKNKFGLEFWGQNIFDRNYYTFVFTSLGNNFGQFGKPARFGASLRIKL